MNNVIANVQLRDGSIVSHNRPKPIEPAGRFVAKWNDTRKCWMFWSSRFWLVFQPETINNLLILN